MDNSIFRCLEKGNQVWHLSKRGWTLRFVKSNKYICGKTLITLYPRKDLRLRARIVTDAEKLKFNLL